MILGLTHIRWWNNIKKGKHYSYLIGDVFTNYQGLNYKIIDYDKNVRRRIIKFDSGCIKNVLISSIIKGNITDYNAKTICGVGCLGMKNACVHFLFWRWLGKEHLR